MKAMIELQLPIRVVCCIPLCENMPSDAAIKPGDVITSRKGLTIEVDNTDAEGRLILADALHYCREVHDPDVIIDVGKFHESRRMSFDSSTSMLNGKL